jgi:hypothetical protein
MHCFIWHPQQQEKCGPRLSTPLRLWVTAWRQSRDVTLARKAGLLKIIGSLLGLRFTKNQTFTGREHRMEKFMEHEFKDNLGTVFCVLQIPSSLASFPFLLSEKRRQTLN